MPLRSEAVGAFTHPHIAQEPLGIEGLPFHPDMFNGQIPVVVEHEPGVGDGKLLSRGQGHGRSYELIIGQSSAETDPPKVVWADEYGNIFTCLVAKGNNFSKAEMIRSATAPSGFIPYGLQEGDALLRVVRASRLLREAGADTEWIVRLQEPQQLYYKGEFVSVVEYKRRLILDLLDQTSNSTPGAEPRSNSEYTKEEVGEIAAAVKDMAFFVTLRAMAAPERMNDLVEGYLLDTKRLSRVIGTYNLVSPYRQPEWSKLGLPERLEEGDGIIEQYFCEVLPKLIGYNMALMHNKGLVHVYPHFGNITVLGGLVDLDSVKGQGLGLRDKLLTKEDFVNDITYIFNEVDNIGIATYFAKISPLFLKDAEEARSKFAINLLCAYLGNRALELTNTKNITEYLELLCDLRDYPVLVEAVDIHISKVAEPYVGKFVCVETQKLVGGTLQFSKEELTDSLFEFYISGLENDYQDYISDNSLPTVASIEEVFREYISIESRRQEVLRWYVESVRYDQVAAEVTSLTAQMQKILENTPLASLESSTLSNLFYSLAQKIINNAIEDYTTPDAKEVDAVIMQWFRDAYLPKLDLNLLPPQNIFFGDEETMEANLYAWQLREGKLSAMFEEITFDILKTMLQGEYKTEFVEESDEVITIKPEAIEVVRAAITDGRIDGFIEGLSYLKLDMVRKDAPKTTYGAFLLQNTKDNSFRFVVKTVKTHF